MEETEYPTLAAFYSARAERRISPETEFGVDWRAGNRDWPLWRVSYIWKTHELYAVRLMPGIPGPARLLGVVPPEPGTDPRRDPYQRSLDKILDGYADADVSGHDLAWVEQRLAAARQK